MLYYSIDFIVSQPIFLYNYDVFLRILCLFLLILRIISIISIYETFYFHKKFRSTAAVTAMIYAFNFYYIEKNETITYT